MNGELRTDEADLAFARVCRETLAIIGNDSPEDLQLRLHADGTLHLYYPCEELFGDAGGYDLLEIAAASVPELRRAHADVKSVVRHVEYWQMYLFAARVRGTRPDAHYYPNSEPGLWPLLDACGPEHPIDRWHPHAVGDERYAAYKANRLATTLEQQALRRAAQELEFEKELARI